MTQSMTDPVTAGGLAGQVALVTGGTAGIGRATVERLARDGAAVVATGRDEARGASVAAGFREAGLDVTYERADVSIAADCRHAVEVTVERHGRLDIVVNNAADLLVASVEETSDEEWDRMIRTNLTSVFLVSKAAIPHIRAAGGGSIVNLASVHAQATVIRFAVYAATKGAIVALTRQMAADLTTDRIRVNALIVGAVATDMSRRHGEALGLPGLTDGAVPDDFALGRTARPEEIAGAIRFLVGPDASFVNGASMIVDGGLLAKLSLA